MYQNWNRNNNKWNIMSNLNIVQSQLWKKAKVLHLLKGFLIKKVSIPIINFQKKIFL